jgi:acetyl-CoA synthetase
MAEELERYHFTDREWDDLEELSAWFEWEIPAEFNIATYACDRWADRNRRVAVFEERPDGATDTYTFWQLQREANRLANLLEDRGVGIGETVAVTGAQRVETLVTHLAAWKVGAISLPLSSLFGPDGLRYRLDDGGARAIVVGPVALDAVREVAEGVNPLDHVLVLDEDSSRPDEMGYTKAISEYPPRFETVSQAPDDPASILYTSGTTGDPKGAILPHQKLLGVLPSFVCSYRNLGPGGVCWLPVEWSWIGLYLPILSNLFYGDPVVAYGRESFDPESAFEIIQSYNVAYALLPPSVLRMMRNVDGATTEYDVGSLRGIVTGGEEIGESIIEWVDQAFDGTVLHSAFGQTEAVSMIGECEALDVQHKQGKLGRPYPGHEVAIVDPETARPVSPGDMGEIAIRYKADPMCFLGYHNLPEKTAAKRRNGWQLTEDLGIEHPDGYLSFESRADDVIISSGYRIGPGEVEESLISHEAVADAGVIGIPAEERGEIVKAFVVLREGIEASDDLADRLKQHVKDRLAKYEYPRELEFIDDLPTTTTGKKQRTKLREWEGIE